MYRYGEACLVGKRREGGLSLLLDNVVAVAVLSLPVFMPLMVPLSEEGVFLESEGRRNFRRGGDISTSVPKLP